MATVLDLSGNIPSGAPAVDKKLTSCNRSNATVPGTLTPQYVGELVSATTLGVIFRGTGTSGTSDWAVDNRVLI